MYLYYDPIKNEFLFASLKEDGWLPVSRVTIPKEREMFILAALNRCVNIDNRALLMYILDELDGTLD